MKHRKELLSIKTYYENTRNDYFTAWTNKVNLAFHFGYYDENANKHTFALNNMNKALAEFGNLKEGDYVLDAGCGVGGPAIWIAENYQCSIVGISVVDSQIEDCKLNAKKRNTKKVDFIVCDYCHTPFPDNHFDVVWSLEAQCHAQNKRDFYNEAFRVLKPGGKLIVGDYIRSHRPDKESNEIVLAEWLHNQAIPDIDTESEHKNNASLAGFQSITVKDVTDNVRVSLRNLNELCRRWYNVGRVMKFFGLANQVRLDNGIAGIRQYEALNSGAWFYAFVRCEKPL